jgi:Flp pilus assembly protein CpaB
MAGQTIAKPRRDKTQRYVFYLGVLLAAIAAVIAFVAVRSADSGTSGDKVPVVVAEQAIPADTRITSDMLKVEFVSPDDANADAFTSRSALVDRVATEDVEAGAQVLTSAVSNVAGDGITFKVAPGMRAISVGVHEVVTAGGNVKPGDHVDVVGIFSVPDAEVANHILQVLGVDYTVEEPPRAVPATTLEGEEVEPEGSDNLVLTVTLLQDVKLLAMGQALTETTAGGNLADELDEAESDPGAATATLELAPQQAQEITWVDNYGIVRMDARAPGDKEIVDVVPTLLRLEETR